MYPTLTSHEGYEARENIFKGRLLGTMHLAEFFKISVSDVDKLSIEEYEFMLETREQAVKEMNKSKKSRKR